MNESKKISTGLGVIGVILCAACCTLPLIGVMIGMGTLSILSKYFEWAGIAAILLAIVFFAVSLYKKQKSKGKKDCGC